jgi:hypothetical protein
VITFARPRVGDDAGSRPKLQDRATATIPAVRPGEEVRVRGTVGTGSRFDLMLPAMTAAGEPQAGIPALAQAGDPRGNGGWQ